MGPDTRLRCFLPKDRLSSLSSLFWWADCYYFLSTGEIKCLVHFGAVGSAGEEFSFSIFYWLRRRSSDQDFYFYSGRLSPFQHRQRGPIAQSLSLSFWKNLTSENFSLSFIYLAPEIWSDHAKMCKNTSLTSHTSSTSSSTHQAVRQKLHSHSVMLLLPLLLLPLNLRINQTLFCFFRPDRSIRRSYERRRVKLKRRQIIFTDRRSWRRRHLILFHLLRAAVAAVLSGSDSGPEAHSGDNRAAGKPRQ